MRKLTSRKFWVAIATIASGVCMMFGFADSSVEVISGAILALGGAVGYMVAEGKLDAKHMGETVEKAGNIIETIVDETDKK